MEMSSPAQPLRPPAGTLSSPARFPSPVQSHPRKVDDQGPAGAPDPAAESLDGDWQMALSDEPPAPTDPGWKPTTVPGQWAVQDPALFNYAGSVWYQKKFVVAPAMLGNRGHLTLQFDGVDYQAQVYLNGHRLGAHEGYFHPFSFDVTGQIKPGADNVLQVKVDAPRDSGFPFFKTQIKGVFGQHDCRPGGFMGGAGLGDTGGIWNGVTLKSTGPVQVEDVHVSTDLAPDHSRAGLRFDYVLNNVSGHDLDARLDAGYGWDGPAPAAQLPAGAHPADAAQSPSAPGPTASAHGPAASPPDHPLESVVHLKPGENHVTLTALELQPHLWWTWDRGTPDLYHVNTTVAVDGKSSDAAATEFGIRSVRLDHGQLFLNGERVFQRGTNYLPTEWLSTYTPAKYAADLQDMKATNLNAVRVHGAAIQQSFFDQADRQGFLVWADFPLIWGHSPGLGFLDQARSQYREFIGQYRNHPSIFVWSAQNEPYPTNWLLDFLLDREAARMDPDRPHVASSPPTTHFYPGWYDFPYGSSMTDIHRYHPELPTEFGAQAVPSSIPEFIPKAHLWPIDRDDWAFHDWQAHENGAHVGDPSAFKSLADYVETSQKYQYDYIRYVAEYFRRNQWKPTGGLYAFWWKDPWAAVGWGLEDWQGRPKLGREALREALAPQLVSIDWTRNRFKPGEEVKAGLWVVNDLPVSADGGAVEWTIQDGHGAVMQQGKAPAPVGADASRAVQDVGFRIPAGAGPGDRWVLRAAWTDAQGRVLSRNEFTFATETPQSGPWRYQPIYTSYPPMAPVSAPQTAPAALVPVEEMREGVAGALARGIRGH